MNQIKNSIGSGNLKRLSALYVKRLRMVYLLSRCPVAKFPVSFDMFRFYLVEVLININLIKKYM